MKTWGNKLDENDIYDVIFIVTRFSYLDSIVPIIENNKSKNIVFVGNNKYERNWHFMLIDDIIYMQQKNMIN